MTGLAEIAETRAFKLNTPAPRQFFSKFIDDTLLLEYCFIAKLGGVTSTMFACGSSVGIATSNVIRIFPPLLTALLPFMFKKLEGFTFL